MHFVGGIASWVFQNNIVVLMGELMVKGTKHTKRRIERLHVGDVLRDDEIAVSWNK